MQFSVQLSLEIGYSSTPLIEKSEFSPFGSCTRLVYVLLSCKGLGQWQHFLWTVQIKPSSCDNLIQLEPSFLNCLKKEIKFFLTFSIRKHNICFIMLGDIDPSEKGHNFVPIGLVLWHQCLQTIYVDVKFTDLRDIPVPNILARGSLYPPHNVTTGVPLVPEPSWHPTVLQTGRGCCLHPQH